MLTVENRGIEDTSNYSVELIDMISGDKIAEAKGLEVKAADRSQVTLRWTAQKAGPVKLQARVVSDSDPVKDNNDSYPYIAQVLPADNTAIAINHGDETLKVMAYPINYYAVESMTQSIFPANEIGITAGTLNSLVFTSCLDADFYGEPFTVFIGETDKADFADGAMVDPASLTKVFDGAVYMKAGVGDLVIPFNETYDYRGGNIVVMCQKLGDEFVMGQYFIVHKTKGMPRSIQSTTNKQGTLVEGGYPDLAADEVYPEIRFNIVKAPAGGVRGKISDEAGPVSGAQVKVAGTQRTETTDAHGNYSFAEIAEGEIALQVYKHGYYVLDGEAFALAANSSEVKDMILTKLPRYTLQGTVTSQTTGDPIKNVRMQLRGYDDYVVMTDENGHYVVPDIAGDSGEDYDMQVTNGYFYPKNSKVNVMADKIMDFTLKEKALRVHNVKATPTNSGCLVTWDEPMPEFRYDSGEPVDYIGWTHGSSEVIVGAAFYKKAKINEISWYATNRYGNHQNFNIFIFGLNAEGQPDAKRLLYTASNVDFTDNAWSSHILSQPVEADGFMIAVSCEGFMGIGICEPTDEYTFEEGQAFYAGDSYTSRISAMSTFAKVHPMLRAYGEDLGDMSEEQEAEMPSRVAMNIVSPRADYKVYRCPEGSDVSEDNLIATASECNLLDTQSVTGQYRYAVVASYPVGDSEAIYSDLIGLSSVETAVADGVAIRYDDATGMIHISGSENVNEIMLVNTAGTIMLRLTSPSSCVEVSSLPAGMYMAVITLSDGHTKSYKLIKR